MAKSIRNYIDELMGQGRAYLTQSITYDLSVNCIVADGNADDKILDMPGDDVMYAWVNHKGKWLRFKRVNVYYNIERESLYFVYNYARYYLDEFMIVE